MSKKNSTPSRPRFWFDSKLVTFITLLLTSLLLLVLHSRSKPPQSTTIVVDHRLFDGHFEGPPKIAFLFLVRKERSPRFHLALLLQGLAKWVTQFSLMLMSLQNAPVSEFSIYAHSRPGFALNGSTTRSAFFQDRQLKNSVEVAWGEACMIEAERLLLGASLDDPANQRFVLLSDSCVPLYNFSYIYNYLMSSPRSFVDSFHDVKEVRYNPKMSPVIPEDKWRKGSQWITLIRKHAEVIVDDDIVFPVFKKFCQWRPVTDLSKGQRSSEHQLEPNCIPDEHYVPTLLMMKGLQNELERRTLTYSLWSQSADKTNPKAWHPSTFNYANSSPQHIQVIKDINHVNYESENRTELCRVNSTASPCFLFARKFSRGAALRLLTDGVVGPYDRNAMTAST
ncbi:hypothetical protein RJ639_028690 [Escallonia herrerae]|uniref:Core-2/I-branching beta-1,6-N-acetylglucosaminyltransferase family protein n=1 Tax=Escallonia herrerae TaxID=1293975 RepID=A0AA89BQK6_9ASTE|nr:hypothetical protein RJ639_028690 [Escallonia herrerae]